MLSYIHANLSKICKLPLEKSCTVTLIPMLTAMSKGSKPKLHGGGGGAEMSLYEQVNQGLLCPYMIDLGLSYGVTRIQ